MDVSVTKIEIKALQLLEAKGSIPSAEVPLKKRNQPVYENEVASFVDEIKTSIEKFRSARTQFMKSFAVKKLPSETEEEDEVVDAYKYRGRCSILRKINFKTNRIRRHYKTLRPARLYTLLRTKSIEVVDMKKKFTKKELSKIIDTSSHESPEITEVGKDGAKENKEEVKKGLLERKFYLGRKIFRKIRHEKEQTETKKKTLSPSQEILEKIRAERKIRKGVTPCKCAAGQGVTFVIKGVCLCDKANITKFTDTARCSEYCQKKINKVLIEEQQKEENQEPKVEKEEDPGSSVAVLKEPQKKCQKKEPKKEETQKEEPQKEETQKEETQKEETQKEETQKKETQKKETQKEPLKENKKDETDSSEFKQVHFVDSKEIHYKRLIKKQSEKDLEKVDKIQLSKSYVKLKKNQKIVDDFQKTHLIEDVSSNDSERLVSADDKERIIKKHDSLVVLYRNKSAAFSESGITEDQMRKLQKVKEKIRKN